MHTPGPSRSAGASGTKIAARAQMLGYADRQTTRLYAQVVHRIEENPARYLSELLWPGE
jgi:hypothetical protein